MRRIVRGAMRSKLVWLGFFAETLGVVYNNFGEVRNIIKPEYFGPILIALGVVVQTFRFFTEKALRDR